MFINNSPFLCSFYACLAEFVVAPGTVCLTKPKPVTSSLQKEFADLSSELYWGGRGTALLIPFRIQTHLKAVITQTSMQYLGESLASNSFPFVLKVRKLRSGDMRKTDP